VGVDNFLSTLLGPVEKVEVTDHYIRLSAGERDLTLTLGMEGEPVKINPDVRALPRLISYSPYHRGWLALYKPDGNWQDKLVYGGEASRWFQEEMDRLEQMGGLADDKAAPPPSPQRWNEWRKTFFEIKD
jgi:glycine cleavage system H lipoate-binding protein